ncbi:hypothetical protein Kpol_529p20 [Vanderwaltozyma polyspora DSM 70294]|uniref:Uncharacterized protein n=1 Tax=Vanderwaltozyma polyspora (strain ATCC 22028 / DSM 70294 / BCRC 21397 / CBS 2163 / NBRC 10782 / NRRL Y-8283 / UCD 57-17) TaxID=436907 RepID=A7TM73_VANPO|nr:uncharacterized protein Kpol_529p20 [Vanderwaltozyma polyspora DSM 70294]EDO16640.1 hypothetical protein Kpol_529p20 [Vanderwaltozyma polyspora DSM 70294]
MVVSNLIQKGSEISKTESSDTKDLEPPHSKNMMSFFNSSPQNNSSKKIFGIFDIMKGYNENTINNELKTIGLERALEFDKKKGIFPDTANDEKSNLKNNDHTYKQSKELNNENKLESDIENFDESKLSRKETVEQSTPLASSATSTATSTTTVTAAESAADIEDYNEKLNEMNQLIINTEILQKNYNVLELTNKELTSDVKRLSDLISERELENSRLNEIISTKDGDIKRLNDIFISKDQEISRLNDSFSLKEQEIKTLSNAFTSKDQEIKRLDDALRLKDQEIKRLDDIFLSKDQEIKRLNDTFISKNEEIKRLNDSLRSKDSDIQTINILVDNLKEFKSLQQENDSNNTKNYSNLISEINLKFEKLNENIKLKDIEINKLNETISELKNKDLQGKYDKDLLNEKLRLQVEQNNKDEDDLKILNGKIKEYEEIINNSKCTISELQANFNEANNTIKNLNAKLDSFVKNLEEANSELSNKDKEINELTLKSTQQKLSIETFNEKLVTNTSQISVMSENLKEERDKLSSLNDLLQTSEASVKSKELMVSSLESKLVNLNDSIKTLDDKIVTMEAENAELKKDNEEMLEKVNKFKNYIQDFKLFDVQVGNLIMKMFWNAQHPKEKSGRYTDAKFIRENLKDSNMQSIVAFKTNEDERNLEELEDKVDSLTYEISKMQKDIENNWEVKCSQLTTELEKGRIELKKEIEKTNAVEAKLEDMKNDNLQLIKEKEITLEKNIALSKEIADLQNKNLEDNESKFRNLVEELNKSGNVVNDLKQELCEKSEQIMEMKNKLFKKEKDFDELKNDYDKQVASIDNLTNSIKKLEGNRYQKITYEIAKKSRPEMDRHMYESLMVDEVDTIDMTQLQNIIKNLILLLEIPFSKLTKKLPLIGIYLKYERPILIHFANQIHYQLYNEEIDTKYFTNKVYTEYIESYDLNGLKHPLEICLDSLYQRISTKL